MANENNQSTENVEITEEQYQEQLSEQHRIRIEKLQQLKSEGKNPYEITKFSVTVKNSEIRADFEKYEN